MTTEKSYGSVLFAREQKIALANKEKEKQLNRKLEKELKANRNRRIELCNKIRNHLLSQIEDCNSDPLFITYHLKEDEDHKWVEHCSHGETDIRDIEIWNNLIRLMTKDELEMKVTKNSCDNVIVQAHPIMKFYL